MIYAVWLLNQQYFALYCLDLKDELNEVKCELYEEKYFSIKQFQEGKDDRAYNGRNNNCIRQDLFPAHTKKKISRLLRILASSSDSSIWDQKLTSLHYCFP